VRGRALVRQRDRPPKSKGGRIDRPQIAHTVLDVRSGRPHQRPGGQTCFGAASGRGENNILQEDQGGTDRVDRTCCADRFVRGVQFCSGRGGGHRVGVNRLDRSHIGWKGLRLWEENPGGRSWSARRSQRRLGMRIERNPRTTSPWLQVVGVSEHPDTPTG
jgi:hypothetical protein